VDPKINPVRLPATDHGEVALAGYGAQNTTAGWVGDAKRGNFLVTAVHGLLEYGAIVVPTGPNPLEGIGPPPVLRPGQQITLGVDLPRVLVLVALTTCRERMDFEPGGIVGMGRIHPHVMVISDMPLLEVHTSVRL